MRVISVMIISLFVGISAAVASPNIETWDTDTSGWLIKDIDGGASYGSLDWASSLGGYSGVLRDTGGGAVGTPQEDIIYTTDTGLAYDVGTYGGFSVQFDFYAQGQVPQKLDIYFKNDVGGNGYVWYLDVTPQLAAGWTSIQEALSFGAGWYNIDDGRTTASEFNADLTDIDEIGVMVYYRNNEGGQVYGLDNFDVVPEPGTWAFLGIAFLSVAYTFRDRIDKACASAKAWIKG